MVPSGIEAVGVPSGGQPCSGKIVGVSELDGGLLAREPEGLGPAALPDQEHSRPAGDDPYRVLGVRGNPEVVGMQLEIEYWPLLPVDDSLGAEAGSAGLGHSELVDDLRGVGRVELLYVQEAGPGDVDTPVGPDRHVPELGVAIRTADQHG